MVLNMFLKISISSYIKIVVLLTLIPGIFLYFNPNQTVLITIICSYSLLFLFFLFFLEDSFRHQFFVKRMYVVYLFVVISFLTYFRGFIGNISFEDIKVQLASGTAAFIFLPLTIMLGSYRDLTFVAFRYFWKYGFLIVSILLIPTDHFLGVFNFSHYSAPIYFFILFIPYVSFRTKLIIIFISIVSFFSDLSVRSNIINILISYGIMLTYFFRSFVFTYFSLKLVRSFFIILPILFLFLGITNVFNVFQFGQIIMNGFDPSSEQLFIDSRTNIYTDVFTQLDKDNSILFGLSSTGKTETFLADLSHKNFDEIYSEGRRGTESGMLNFIQYSGLTGAFIYFLVFIISSFKCVYKSNNWFFVMLGAFLMFKGMFSFIEDRIFFNTNILFLFLCLGLSFNRSFLNLNEFQIKSKIKYIFS